MYEFTLQCLYLLSTYMYIRSTLLLFLLNSFVLIIYTVIKEVE